MNTDSKNTGYYSIPKQNSGHISIDLQDNSSMKKNKDKLLTIEDLIGDSLKNILSKQSFFSQNTKLYFKNKTTASGF